jgi:formylglycine-generating enzyme required for sulfatase activity
MRLQIYKSTIQLLVLLFLTVFFQSYFLAWAEAKPSVPENMVLINPGGFMRGIDKEKPAKGKSKMSPAQKFKYSVSQKAFTDEGPAGMVYLSAYYIDKYEVSNDQYTEFIKATDYSAPAYWDHHHLNQPNQPVTGVNWYDANAYCNWANKRLPTEAEWEKAARGPAGLIYPWGNEMNITKANFARGSRKVQGGEKYPATVNVDSHPEGKSYYGVYNMAGNVFEWVQDWYDPNYYTASKDVRNPQGPLLGIKLGTTGTYIDKLASGKKKVIRGGSWFAPAHSITTTHRFWNDPMNNSYGVGLGFRCARSVESNPEMQARSFYMDALIQMGAEKYKEALVSINKALKSIPEDKEYRALKDMIIKRNNR